MARSIMQKHKECYITGRTDNLHKHHIFGGANRRLSEEYGLWVWLTPEWHNMSDHAVHWGNHELDLALKQKGQAEFEKHHTREEFMSIFGRSWL